MQLGKILRLFLLNGSIPQANGKGDKMHILIELDPVAVAGSFQGCVSRFLLG